MNIKNEYKAPELKDLGSLANQTKNGSEPNFDDLVDDTPAFPGGS